MAPLLSESDAGRLVDMIHHFFMSSLDLLVALRSPVDLTGSSNDPATVDWFNLQVPVADHTSMGNWMAKDVMKIPPLVLETVLDLTRLSPSESITFQNSIINTGKKSEIVLERWLFHLNLDDYATGDNFELEITDIYKNIIVLFRCLYSLMMFLPAYNLKQSPNLNNTQVKIKVLDGSKSIPSKGRIGLSKALNHSPESNEIKSRDLSPILTPIGSLNVSVSYREICDFKVQLNEEVFSNHFQQSLNLSNPFHNNHKSSTSPVLINDSNTYDKNNNTNTNTNTTNTTIINNVDDQLQQQQPKQRVSVTSIESVRSRRKSSIRSTSLFKTGSLASSSPPSHHQPHIDIIGGEGTPSPSQLKHISLTPRPIPMGRDLSSVSINSRREMSASGESGYGSYQPEAIKISSSFGSKFKGGANTSAAAAVAAHAAAAASRHNSIDDRISHHSNPVLEGLKAKHRLMSSLSVDSDSDDLTGFMKLLESKPDLRFSGSGFISNDDSVSDIFEDSLKNYRSLRNTDIFKDISYTQSQSQSQQQMPSEGKTMSPQPPPTAITDKNVSDSVIRLLTGTHSPLSSSPTADPYNSISMIPRPSRGSRSSINHISPSSTNMKASAIAGTSSIGAFGDMRRGSDSRSKRLSNSSSPGAGSVGGESLIERLRRGSIGSNSAAALSHSPEGGLMGHSHLDNPNAAVSSQLRYVLSHALSTSSPSSAGVAGGENIDSRRSSGTSNRYLSGELKTLSYGQGVFDSDDEEEPLYPAGKEVSPGVSGSNGDGLIVAHSMVSGPVSGVSGVQIRHQRGAVDEEEEDDLVFEMSDMKN